MGEKQKSERTMVKNVERLKEAKVVEPPKDFVVPKTLKQVKECGLGRI